MQSVIVIFPQPNLTLIHSALLYRIVAMVTYGRRSLTTSLLIKKHFHTTAYKSLLRTQTHAGPFVPIL